MFKPRARWQSYGRGYWTVRSFYNSWLIQGVGFGLEGAFKDWQEQVSQAEKGYIRCLNTTTT